MIGRRGLLSLIGLAPLAATQASAHWPTPPPPSLSETVRSAGPTVGRTELLRRAQAAGLVSKEDFADFLLSEYGTGNVRVTLDPDLEVMRSFSTTAKLRIQRERDRQTALMKDAIGGSWWARSEFLAKKLGLWSS
jgi:hypothetical protein